MKILTFFLVHNNLNINLIGKINANQIVDEICDSDFFVQTSIIDNSPNALCEAQLLGIPVITTSSTSPLSRA